MCSFLKQDRTDRKGKECQRRDRQTYSREGKREREECEGKRMRERNVFECCRQFRDKELSKGHQILNYRYLVGEVISNFQRK